MKKLLFLLPVLLSAQTQSWMGINSGYVYFGFTGVGSGSNNFTTAKSADGITSWTNLGGSWTGKTGAINAPDVLYHNNKWYFHVATTSDANLHLVPWLIGLGDAASGTVTTIATIDWTSSISGINSCFSGGLYEESGTVHVFVPCSISDISHFKVYETHATASDLTTWSSPVDVGVGFTNFIDAEVYKIGSKYFMWGKDETNKYVVLVSATALTGPYSTVEKTGDWASWGSALEGPKAYPNGSGWYLMFEAYDAGHVMYYSSCSNPDFTVCTWSSKTLWTEDVSTYRHGSVLFLSPPAWQSQMRGLATMEGLATQQ